MSRQIMCNTCEGTGKQLIIYEEPCPCHFSTTRIDTNVYDGHCKICNGRGRIPRILRSDMPCNMCNGSGMIAI
jgi:RecJ-like exonuclease